MTPIEVKKLAYEYAQQNENICCNIPNSWHTNKQAGKDWLTNFLKRNNNISIRTPESTSMARASAFNSHNVTTFFKNLLEVQNSWNFEAQNIWNVDETGCTTVQHPSKVLAEKGTRQVGTITSAERGVLVIVCCAVSATGNTVPLFFLFPRAKFQQHWLYNAPPRSAGIASRSGWITADLFQEYLQHFKKHVQCDTDHPVLLLLDNNKYHVSFPVIEYARQNGIVLLSFPPHCSHKSQPLDVSVFSSFKNFYNVACKDWLIEHKGERITIQIISTLVGKAFERSMTIHNITSGFRATGISPLDRNIFQEEDFLTSAVTDRPPLPAEHAETIDTAETLNGNLPPNASEVSGNCSYAGSDPILSEQVRPFTTPKPKQRKRKRKSKKSSILTSTPEKEKNRKTDLSRKKEKIEQECSVFG